MPLGPESLRIAIAGVTSLRGKDLKEWVEEGGFPVGEIRLFDEELAAGTLTDVGGEPTVVQLIDDSSFDRCRFVFFTGSPTFANKHAQTALRAGSTVIDLSGGLAGFKNARLWVPELDSLLAPPVANGRLEICVSPSVPALVAISLSAAFRQCSLSRMAITFMYPASERGQVGVSELEEQTIKLLSLQKIPQQVFDEQVAFNLLDRWGPDSSEKLSESRDRISLQVAQYLSGRAPVPAITAVQAPVFFGFGFSAYVEFESDPGEREIQRLMESVGFRCVPEDDPGPSNLLAAGESGVQVRVSHKDCSVKGGYWLWGAADNLRVGSANAVRIAERLLAS